MSDIKKDKLKVGDWVQVLIIGFGDEHEPPYQIEKIDGDEYIIVQREKFYKHRLTVKEEKLKKL